MEKMGKAKKLMNRTMLTHLLLVSVISLCSSLFFSPSSFLHYFNIYFSSFTSQIFSHTIDKNCMFLLCNGLLVFLGITRSFSNSDPDHDDHDRRLYDDDDELLEGCSSIEVTAEVDQVKELKVEIDAEMAGEEEEEEEEDDDDDDDDDDEDEEEGKESDVLLGLDMKEEEEEWLDNEEILDEGNVEEENSGLSTEQMNKKFDDFIRRMKEDLRIEAKRQLVMVSN